jgi:hypothetical protein
VNLGFSGDAAVLVVIAAIQRKKKFSVNSCLPDFPLIKSAAFYGEIRKTGIYERKYNQTCTFPIGIKDFLFTATFFRYYSKNINHYDGFDPL